MTTPIEQLARALADVARAFGPVAGRAGSRQETNVQDLYSLVAIQEKS